MFFFFLICKFSKLGTMKLIYCQLWMLLFWDLNSNGLPISDKHNLIFLLHLFAIENPFELLI